MSELRVTMNKGASQYEIPESEVGYYKEMGFTIPKAIVVEGEEAKLSRDEELEELTVSQLKVMLEELEVDIPANAKKADLIQLAKDAE